MLLAVDTSTPRTGLALYDGARVAGVLVWDHPARQTGSLAPAAAELLARAGLSVRDLAALGVALGPGSFTGLRVGLAFVKGLAYARQIPLVGVPTLDATAAAQPPRDLPLAAALPAGRGRLAVAWYEVREGRWQARGPARVMTAEELAGAIEQPTLVCGEFTAEQRALLARGPAILPPPALAERRPEVLAMLAWERWQARPGGDDPSALAPIYLHIAEPLPA